ncbi:DUF2092 domain-containing protein [Allochromatium palmeri]|uniref:DUF2092 domain-containing protein n=1 Tax=Allochromatium palmeri TaxID=231048 RepID=A0A6N8EF83_9GAMM|nr:DUF2092 domain-containing protein [Allochromatium palmeri]MTW21306.1 DUF2092 domain-containing protein [Allochromatium palmeri]
MKPAFWMSAMLAGGLSLTGCATLHTDSSDTTSTQLDAPSTVAPDPTTILKEMAAYLRSLERFSVRVEKVTEYILPSDQSLHNDQTIEIALSRPNHLRVDFKALGGGRQLFYDGENFAIFTPHEGVYATASAPSTIDETLEILYNEYQIELPVADLLATDPASRLVQDLKSRTYVGRILVDGVPCHHLAFRTPDLDWEIWIEAGPKPLPRRLLLTDRGVEGAPTLMANLTDWDVSPSFARGFFEFKPPANAQRISFMNQMSATLTPTTNR